MDENMIITVYLSFWLAILGAVAGSFIDCAVSRWAAGGRMFAGRSQCAACGRTLGAAELVPVFSWLFRRGRCRYCGGKIPADCLAAELAGAAGFVCLGLEFGPEPELLQWLVWAGLLLALSLTDWARRIIPDGILVALAVNRLGWVLFLGEDANRVLWSALGACSIPAALLALVLLAERLIEREVMGGGDVKLLFVLALYLDWAQLLLTLLAGCLLGLAWAALPGGRRRASVAFGPFLAVGAAFTVCFGGPLIQMYLGLF